MIFLESGTMLLVDGFLARHPQHEVVLRIRSENRVTVSLVCHNGHNWQGWNKSCFRKDLDATVRELLEQRPIWSDA